MSVVGNQAPLPVPPPEIPISPLPAGEPKRKRYWNWLVLLVIVGGAVASYELWVKPRHLQQQAAKQAVAYRTARVTRGPLVYSIRIAGQTSPRDFANITAPLLRGPDAGRAMVLMKLVPSGTMVKKGDFLAEIDSQSLRDHIDDVVDMVKQAGNDIEKRKAQQAVERENMSQTMRVAKADWEKWLLESRAAETRTALDQELIKLQVEESEARYKQALADLEQKKVSHAAELRILEITLERQKRHLERHSSDAKRMVFKSPMDGLAVMATIWRNTEYAQIQEGDTVSPGQPFMKVVSPGSMQLEASINQAQSSEFRVGLKATVGLDAFPGVTFPGKVYSIGALAVGGYRQNYYIRNVPVRVEILSNDPRLIPDLSAWADVEIAREDNALLVPLGALRSKGEKTFVSVKRPNGFQEQEVEIGLSNNIFAAVLSGLKEGDEVKLD